MFSNLPQEHGRPSENTVVRSRPQLPVARRNCPKRYREPAGEGSTGAGISFASWDCVFALIPGGTAERQRASRLQDMAVLGPCRVGENYQRVLPDGYINDIRTECSEISMSGDGLSRQVLLDDGLVGRLAHQSRFDQRRAQFPQDRR